MYQIVGTLKDKYSIIIEDLGPRVQGIGLAVLVTQEVAVASLNWGHHPCPGKMGALDGAGLDKLPVTCFYSFWVHSHTACWHVLSGHFVLQWQDRGAMTGCGLVSLSWLFSSLEEKDGVAPGLEDWLKVPPNQTSKLKCRMDSGSGYQWAWGIQKVLSASSKLCGLEDTKKKGHHPDHVTHLELLSVCGLNKSW